MHDQVLNLLDDCVARLLLLRDDLAASRRVLPGERRLAVLEAIEAAEHFAAAASQAIGDPEPVALIDATH